VALVIDLAPRSLALTRPLAGRWPWPDDLPGRQDPAGPGASAAEDLRRALLRRGANPRYTPPRPPMQEIEKILSRKRATAEQEPLPGAGARALFVRGAHGEEIMVRGRGWSACPSTRSPRKSFDLLAEEGHTACRSTTATSTTSKGAAREGRDSADGASGADVLQTSCGRRCSFPGPSRWASSCRDCSRSGRCWRGGGRVRRVLRDRHARGHPRRDRGEIHDEHDKEGPAPQFGPDGTALVRAEVRVDDLNESLGPSCRTRAISRPWEACSIPAAGAIPQTGDRFYIGA